MSAIRVLALAVIRRGGELLVEEGVDEVKGERFRRLPGGGIEFGEPGADAVRRELREELGVELAGLRSLGAVENIFTYRGRAGHEVAFLYEARFSDVALYERERFPVLEPDAETPFMQWVDPGDGLPLYPEGTLELVQGP